MNSPAPRRAVSIAVPIVALVIVAVTLSTLLLFAITFSGPPPRPAPHHPETLARALMTGQVAGRESRRLLVTTARAAPLPDRGKRRVLAIEANLARRIGISPDRVRAYATRPPHRADSSLFGDFTLALRTDSGWRIVRTAPEPWLTPWHRVTLGAMAGGLLILGAIGWWVARAISRPLRRLAEAAAHTRPGMSVDIPRGGPREVDALAASLDAMQTRLIQAADGRSAMFAAIAHDLGTPLSRLAFWTEQLPDHARERALADIDEIRGMLQAVLRLAQNERADAPPAKVDLGSVIEALADDMIATGAPVTVAEGPRVIVRGDPAALRRMLANLVENAVRYGERAAIDWSVADGRVTIRIDDGGPGFDSATSDALFTPFVRGDPSRNRATGGTGLGLAIVRSIAEAHGGTVTLTRHDAGGRVLVTLPLD